MARKLGDADPCGSPWSLERGRRAWTLEVASRAAGVSLSHLCDVENGRRLPGFPTLLRLAKVYGLTLDQAHQLTKRTAKWRAAKDLQVA